MLVELTDAEVVEVVHALSIWRTDIGLRVDQALAEGHTDVLERAEATIARIDALAAKFGARVVRE